MLVEHTIDPPKNETNQGYLKVLQVLIFNRTYFAWDKGQEFTYSTIITNVKSSVDGDSNYSWLL